MKLCYIEDGCWAMFTDAPLDEVRGDDWNDAPYDCNAGPRYFPAGQTLIKVAFDGDVAAPTGWTGERIDWQLQNVSIDDLIAGRAPWLIANPYGFRPEPLIGEVTLERFRAFIRAAGGKVYTA